jgi:hypothetical protein
MSQTHQDNQTVRPDDFEMVMTDRKKKRKTFRLVSNAVNETSQRVKKKNNVNWSVVKNYKKQIQHLSHPTK